MGATPANRLESWKKLWATPRQLSDEETESAFEQFQDALVPSHMRKRFVKSFGVPKAVFGNRYFGDGAGFHGWETKMSSLGADEGGQVEATVIYGTTDSIEGHVMRGQSRRTVRDIFVDDWHAGCAIVRTDRITIYLFVEPKMRGCIALSVQNV
jgi:hypothetical protein